jgi:hypothetical protein
MKVGILTFHYSNNNYGALLQTYASVQVLKRLGCDSSVIDLLPEELKKRKSLFRRCIGILCRNPFEIFRRRFLPMTYRINKAEDLKKTNALFDAFYVGSDQVWRKEFAQEHFYHYFLDFVEDEKIKMAYAPSFGKDTLDLSKDELCRIKKLLYRFAALSIREEGGRRLCASSFGLDAPVVLDPTLLLDAKDYNSIIGTDTFFKNKYVAIYQLGNEKTESVAKAFAMDHQISVKYINGRTYHLFHREIRVFPIVSEWLAGIRDAEYIVTDSFHGVIFSILYKKNFVCLQNSFGGNDRLLHLLNMFGLGDRLICDYKDVDDLNSIVYDLVYDKLEKMRKVSFSFLNNALYNVPSV